MRRLTIEPDDYAAARSIRSTSTEESVSLFRRKQLTYKTLWIRRKKKIAERNIAVEGTRKHRELPSKEDLMR